MPKTVKFCHKRSGLHSKIATGAYHEKRKKFGPQHNAFFLQFFRIFADSCTNIKSVGKPVTHNARYYSYGAWMKDPLGIMGAETIFSMGKYYTYEVQEFENMDKFKAGVARKTYKLPYYWDGTGAVVYGPYLYYNR